MYVQCTTDASRPTIRLPDTADPVVVGVVGGLAGTTGEVGSVFAGGAEAGARVGALAGCVGPWCPGGNGRRGEGFRLVGPAWRGAATRGALRLASTRRMLPLPPPAGHAVRVRLGSFARRGQRGRHGNAGDGQRGEQVGRDSTGHVPFVGPSRTSSKAGRPWLDARWKFHVTFGPRRNGALGTSRSASKTSRCCPAAELS